MIKQSDIYREVSQKLKEKGIEIDYRVVGAIMRSVISLVKADMTSTNCWGKIELPYIGTFYVKKRFCLKFKPNGNKPGKILRNDGGTGMRNGRAEETPVSRFIARGKLHTCEGDDRPGDSSGIS